MSSLVSFHPSRRQIVSIEIKLTKTYFCRVSIKKVFTLAESVIRQIRKEYDGFGAESYPFYRMQGIPVGSVKIFVNL